MIEPGTITTDRPLTPQERAEKYGAFLLNESLPRPSRENHPNPQFVPDQELARLQRQWDNADELRANIAKGVATRRAMEEASIKAKAAAHQAAQDEESKEAAAAFENRLRVRYLSLPGTDMQGWAAVKDQIIADERARLVHAGATADDIVRRQASRENRARF